LPEGCNSYNNAEMNAEVEINQLNRIALPEASLIVLCGIAGCGKSTFAAKHFLPTQIVSSDECRARICDDAMNQQVTGQAFELWRLIIRKRLLLDRLTVADATNLENGDRLWLVKAAHYYRHFCAAILFDIPLEICLSRNATRKRVVPEEAVIRQHQFFQASLKSINREGFDAVYVLNEDQQSLVTVEITSAAESLPKR
jgi:protein phosphatase